MLLIYSSRLCKLVLLIKSGVSIIPMLHKVVAMVKNKLMYNLVLREYDHKRKLACNICVCVSPACTKAIKNVIHDICGCSNSHTYKEWEKYMQPPSAQYGNISVKWFFDPFTHYTTCGLLEVFHHYMLQIPESLQMQPR